MPKGGSPLRTLRDMLDSLEWAETSSLFRMSRLCAHRFKIAVVRFVKHIEPENFGDEWLENRGKGTKEFRRLEAVYFETLRYPVLPVETDKESLHLVSQVYEELFPQKPRTVIINGVMSDKV